MVEITSQPLKPASAQEVRDAVDIARQTLQSLKPGDDGYFSALNDFADKLMTRFQNSGNPSDLDEGLARSKEVLALRKPGDPAYVAALSNVGTTHRTRFRFRGDIGDLTEAIDCFQAAVESSTPEHLLYLGFVGNLAGGLLDRYRNYGDIAALDRVVQVCSTALSATSKNQHRDSLLNNYANALKERFEQQGNSADLDAALERYQDCLNLRPPGHPLRHTVLGNLADAMLVKFETDNDIQTLENAARHYVLALQLTPPGHDGYLRYLSGLGVAFWYAYMKGDSDPQRLDMAISCFSTALSQPAAPNMDRVRILDSYGAALLARHIRSENINDLNQGITYLTTSLTIQSSKFTGRYLTFLHLGNGLFARFNAVGNIADLDAAIEHLSASFQSCPPTHQQRHAVLGSYGRALAARFDERGDEKDLTLAASLCKEALTLASPTASTYHATIVNLTSTMITSLRGSGNIDDIQTIIDFCDRALATPRSLLEPELITLKANRGLALLEKFKYGRETMNADIAVQSLREVISLLPEGHTQYVASHISLGMALEARFRLTPKPQDLGESIEAYRIAQCSCKRGKFTYVHLCINLAIALYRLFEYSNRAIDALNEAIVLLSDAEEMLASTPGNSRYAPCLVNVGNMLFQRFHILQKSDDLDEAIKYFSHVLTLPTFSGDFIARTSLASAFNTRHDINKDLGDLERSIELFEAALQNIPASHLDRALLCRSYGRALIALAHYRDAGHNLSAAIKLLEKSIEDLPNSHPDQLLSRLLLLAAYYELASLDHYKEDELEGETKEILRSFVQNVRDDHPSMHMIQRHSIEINLRMYTKSNPKNPAYLDDVFIHYEKAALYNHKHSYGSVKAGLEWVNLAETHGHSSALRAYQASLNSLDHLLLTTASVKSRHAILRDGLLSSKHVGSLATDATSCALDQGQIELAVELSEQGRGLLWSQLSRVRTPLDSLRSADEEGKELASEFERIGSELAINAASAPYEAGTRRSTEEATRRYQQLTSDLDAVVARIQKKEGFQSFLRRVSFQTLRTAAEKGPVILVNISRKRCDAIILLHDDAPRLVPLPDATIDEITDMSTELYQSLKATSRVGEEKQRERLMVPVLRNLWDMVVSPIVNELATFLPRGSRIWWCPTSRLTSLPLHAAGPYRKGAHNLASIYISSYTPTLTALIRSRRAKSLHLSHSQASSSTDTQAPAPSLIAIGQSKPPSTSSEAELLAIDSELALLRSLVPPLMRFDHLSGPTSTAYAALSALRTHAWVHLACHGNQDLAQPFDSAFALGDRELTLLDIVRALTPGESSASDQEGEPGFESEPGQQLETKSKPGLVSEPVPEPVHSEWDSEPQADNEFAFLSACHTAVGDAHTPDEVIHLAAGMQFSGFRSVIGTMWAVDDAMAQKMVSVFYKSMFQSVDADGGGVDYANAARALNKAVKTVGEGVSFDQRIVFIHIGA